MRLIGSAVLGLVVGALYLFLSVMIGMSIGSLITGAATLAVIVFLTVAVITTVRRRAPLWPFPLASALPLLMVAALGGPAVASATFFTLGGATLVAGFASCYVSAALSNNRWRGP
jgi:hypothetical protein